MDTKLGAPVYKHLTPNGVKALEFVNHSRDMRVPQPSLVEVNGLMSQARFNTGLGTRRAVAVQLYAPRPRRSGKALRQELEAKLATLQKDYAELHTAIFEAA